MVEPNALQQDDPTAAATEPTPGSDASPANLADERLIQSQSLGDYARAFGQRIRGGDLGSLPVVLGLVIICIAFYAKSPGFLSSYQIVSMTQFAAPIGIIALATVLVLLVGEIDLSIGSVSGMAAAIMAVQMVHHGQSMAVSLLLGIASGAAVGLLYSILFVRLGVPSFVFSLAGLLGFQGVLLFVLGKDGTINLPPDAGIVRFARTVFVSGTAAYVLVVVIVAVYLAASLWGRRRRLSAGLPTLPILFPVAKAVLMLVGLLFLTWYLNINRGWSALWLLFVALVVITDLLLRKTRWGRHLFAIGGNEEAARRAGINVTLIYVSVFVACSTLSAVGGLLAAGQLTAVSQTSGTTDTNLTAIAAAVIGGTSLFGGRGSAYSAMLGIMVLQAIQTGLNVIGVDSSVRFMVTGGVLLVAVAIDSISRKARSSSGRG
ncbi:MAG TPA: sugar ABC transporter permease [Marmoricola sp.]|nr:sugar ABC transporter permease [Marmoricola sp.]